MSQYTIVYNTTRVLFTTLRTNVCSIRQECFHKEHQFFVLLCNKVSHYQFIWVIIKKKWVLMFVTSYGIPFTPMFITLLYTVYYTMKAMSYRTVFTCNSNIVTLCNLLTLYIIPWGEAVTVSQTVTELYFTTGSYSKNNKVTVLLCAVCWCYMATKMLLHDASKCYIWLLFALGIKMSDITFFHAWLPRSTKCLAYFSLLYGTWAETLT